MSETRSSRAATVDEWAGKPDRRSRQRGDAEAVTRGEFSASRKAACEFRQTVTNWMDKIDLRMDKQDVQLDGIAEIQRFMGMICKLVQWSYKAVLATVAIVAPFVAIAKAMGWI